MASAVSAYGSRQRPGQASRGDTKRADPVSYDPLRERAKLLSDLLWERAKRIADLLAPEHPVDQEPIDEMDQWLLLEQVALSLSPLHWDRPDAIMDLYNLRKKFMPERDHDALKAAATYQEKQRKMLPDPSVTPQSPEWERKQARLGVSR